MKKTILSIAFIAAAIFAASCQKESLQENTATEGSASVFTATIETGASTKTTVERVDGTEVIYKTKWESTDQISINGVTYTAIPDGTDATKATFAKDSGNDPTGTFKAYFPATMYSDSKATLPASYSYADGKYNMPMYAESTTTSLSFKNLCGVLAITVKGTDFTSVNSIEVSSDTQMNGEFTATAEGVLSFASVTLTDALKKVNLSFASAKSIASDGSATFYIPVPAATHNPLTIKVSDGTTTKTMVTQKSGGVPVARNTVYPIDFYDNSEALPGVFTVKAETETEPAKKVRFSQGNLWYGPRTTGASSTFNFETNQYKISSSWDESHVSNFYWSRTANYACLKDYSDYGYTTDILFTNATETTPNTDFTVNGITGVWRTLSQAEWQYLLNKHKYEYVQVNGIYGIVIAPDEFSGRIKESYDATTWATAEAAGLVFLPITGYRTGGYIYEVSGDAISCIYWTSTAESGNHENAYRMFFQWKRAKSELEESKLDTNFNEGGKREWAAGIRLVTDVK